MKLHLLGIALLAACTTVCAQTQSGSTIGADSPGVGGNVQPRPLPPTSSPSTGAGAPSAGTQGSSQRLPETSVGTSAASSGSTIGERSTGLCDTLTGEDRTKCLREQATTGTAGPGSVGGSTGGGLK